MKKAAVISLVLLILVPASALAFSAPPDPPGQPSSGPGSAARHISPGFTEFVTGSGSAGTRVWWYVPDTMKNGSSAPVVVFLHGMMCLAPDIYAGHIDHLARQGYIVIFPQFNKGGVGGMVDDLMLNADQNEFLARAIAATDTALDRLGAVADTSDLTLYGHSLGGLMATCWTGAGGPAPQRIVLASPCMDAKAGIPDFVSWMVAIDELDFPALAPATFCPVNILWGNKDNLATWGQMEQACNALTNAASVNVYRFNTDGHGDPELTGDHMACIQDDGWMPSWVMGMFGGDGEEDAVDYRYFYAGLDQALDGLTDLYFDMGSWSDGRAVNPVVHALP